MGTVRIGMTMGGFLTGLLVGAPIGMGIGIAAIALCMAGKDGDMDELKVMLDEGAFLPERAHATDAGADIRTPRDVLVPGGGSAVVRTGVHVQLNPGTAGFIQPKSGLNVKNDVLSFGIIDEGYTGELVVKLYNLGEHDVILPRGSKVSQLIEVKVGYPRIVQVDEISGGERGDAGFGSTDDTLGSTGA